MLQKGWFAGFNVEACKFERALKGLSIKNCKRLRAPPRQPGRPTGMKGLKKGGGGGEGRVVGVMEGRGVPGSQKRSVPGGVGGVNSQTRAFFFRTPPSEGGGGGCVTTFCRRVGLGGRRPDPGLLVSNASRQEAEANMCGIYLSGSKNVTPSSSMSLGRAPCARSAWKHNMGWLVPWKLYRSPQERQSPRCCATFCARNDSDSLPHALVQGVGVRTPAVEIRVGAPSTIFPNTAPQAAACRLGVSCLRV